MSCYFSKSYSWRYCSFLHTNFLTGTIFNNDNDLNEVALKAAAARISLVSKNYNVTPIIYRIGEIDGYRVGQIGKKLFKKCFFTFVT